MKKKISLWTVLLSALLFTGCTEYAIPNEDIGVTGQLPDEETKEEVTDNNILDNEDGEEKYDNLDQGKGETIEVESVMLSEEELTHVQQVIAEYYVSINQKMIDFVQTDNAATFIQEYEGYESGEVAIFEVSVENSENKRYIAIGSKDNWENCNVLNEGY